MNFSRTELFKTLGIVGAFALAGGYLRYSITEQMGKLNAGLMIAGGVLLLVAIVANFGAILQSSQRRSTRLGANSIAMTVAVLAILGFANFLGYRHHKRFDLTSEKLYTLSDQTKKVLLGLQKDVKVLHFNKTDDGVADVIEEYRNLSNRITYEKVDLQARPEMANQFRGVRPGETLVAAANRHEKVASVDEQSLTSAIMKVTRDKAKTICSVEGHGERELMGGGPEGYSDVNTLVKNDNYDTKSINLSANNLLLSECSVVILAGPKKPLLQSETETLSKYLADGGKILLAVDPDNDPDIDDLLKDWNIELRKDIVIEPTIRMAGAGPALVVGRDYASHAITKNLSTNLPVVFPLTQSLKSDSSKSEITINELIKTSANGYGKTDIKTDNIAPVEGKDNKGPLTLALAASKKGSGKDARLVVLGDSDFASNLYQRRYGNSDFFVNSINWLAEEEDLISIRPKSMTSRSVELSSVAQNLLFWLTIFLPISVLGLGAAMWWKRR